jgi:hypothetical protein
VAAAPSRTSPGRLATSPKRASSSVRAPARTS